MNFASQRLIRWLILWLAILAVPSSQAHLGSASVRPSWQIDRQPGGAAFVLTTTRVWDYGSRLRSLTSTLASSPLPVGSFTYTYDAFNRRTWARLADQSTWTYDYDDRNEVIAGKHRWADFRPVSGQQFGYAYDAQGNRSSATWGGDGNGLNLRTTAYTPNALNQYTAITTPGYLDVSGLVWATNSVTLNGQNTDRKSEYWHAQLAVANTNQPVWQSVSAVSVTTTNSGFALCPSYSRSLTYDADGNLTGDGLWTYAWDGENRLVSVESVPTLSPATARRRVEFGYDHRGRRVTRKSYTWDSGSWLLTSNFCLLYDGWNLLAELNQTNKAVIRSYAWGLDVANSLPGADEGAGGIGGLVMVKSHVSPTGTHFPAYDGNGNVVALVDTGGTVSARYEYGPFGEPLTVWGAAARLNPFRWSTKQTDNETDLVYYGYRYYSPGLGRWISRDPLEERGGANLYGFLLNDSLSNIDPDAAAPKRPGLMAAMQLLGFAVQAFNATVGYTDPTVKGTFYEIVKNAGMIGDTEGPYLGGDVAPTPSKGPGKIWDPFRANAKFTRRDRVLKMLRRGSKIASGAAMVATVLAGPGIAESLAQNARDYARHIETGDSAWADLDAISVAVDIQNLGQDYFVTMGVLGLILND